MVVRLAIVTNL